MSTRAGRYGNSRSRSAGGNGPQHGVTYQAAIRSGTRKSAHTLAREQAQSGEPAPEGRGYCPECYRPVLLKSDGTLGSHRPNGYLCVGIGALPYVHTTTTTEGTT